MPAHNGNLSDQLASVLAQKLVLLDALLRHDVSRGFIRHAKRNAPSQRRPSRTRSIAQGAGACAAAAAASCSRSSRRPVPAAARVHRPQRPMRAARWACNGDTGPGRTLAPPQSRGTREFGTAPSRRRNLLPRRYISTRLPVKRASGRRTRKPVGARGAAVAELLAKVAIRDARAGADAAGALAAARIELRPHLR